MPAIHASERSDRKGFDVDVDIGTTIDLVLAVERTPATATISVHRIGSMSGAKVWQISDEEFQQAGGRVTKQLSLDHAERFQVDFFAYASGSEARVMFKVSDPAQGDGYRSYGENDGQALYAPWGAVAVNVA